MIRHFLSRADTGKSYLLIITPHLLLKGGDAGDKLSLGIFISPPPAVYLLPHIQWLPKPCIGYKPPFHPGNIKIFITRYTI